MLPKVCMITVCYNDASRLPTWIEGLERQRYDNIQHILVDNNSSDNSVAFLKTNRPSIIIQESKVNLATTGGYNLALRKALEFNPDYILFSAIDVVLDPDCLAYQVEKMESDSQIGIIGPVVYEYDNPNIVQSSGFIMNYQRMVVESQYGWPIERADIQEMIVADWVDGGTALVRRSVMEQLGEMDENLCIYCEDVDLCYRTRELGYKVMVITKAKAYHNHIERNRKGPPAYEIFYTSRNRIYLARKYYGVVAGWKVFAHWLIPRGRKRSNVIRFAQRDGKPRIILAYYLGALYGVLGIMGKRLFLK